MKKIIISFLSACLIVVSLTACSTSPYVVSEPGDHLDARYVVTSDTSRYPRLKEIVFFPDGTCALVEIDDEVNAKEYSYSKKTHCLMVGTPRANTSFSVLLTVSDDQKTISNDEIVLTLKK